MLERRAEDRAREKERRDLVLLHYVEPTRSPFAAADGDAFGHAGYFAELIDEWAPDNDPNETYAAWQAALALPSVRGLVVGRTMLYPADDDVAKAVDTAVSLVR